MASSSSTKMPRSAEPSSAADRSARGPHPSIAARRERRRVETPADAESESQEDPREEGQPSERRRLRLPSIGWPQIRWRHALQNFGSVFVSMAVHLVALLVLGWLTIASQPLDDEQTLVASVPDPTEEEDLRKLELDEVIRAAAEPSQASQMSVSEVGAAGEASASAAAPMLDQKMVEKAERTQQMAVDAPILFTPPDGKLMDELPKGALGDPRAIVDDYQEAMSRLTQEIAWLIDKGPVMVVWAFDQSESMKDDQEELRQRIDRVYDELGLTGRSDGKMLATGVVSYGQKFAVHTREPTSNRYDIDSAIRSVPIDPSGKEIMCEAVIRTLAHFGPIAQKQKRQMVLILVTDESGEQENNARFLEDAIAAANSADCRIYTLGRESVFGYPYAHIRWQHPQTKHIHWLPINRGPETAFVEQLQTNGFRKRHDAFPSGYGPYEQTRMARETQGIFFMLPSVETNLVRGEKRRYQLDAMRPYRPDLRARMEIVTDRDQSVLRKRVWKVINDLNPYNKQAAKIINMRHGFSINPAEFVQQAVQEQRKALVYLDYLAKAQRAMEEVKSLREQEADPRWQANYDLIYAQIIAYQARIYEYGAYLEEAKKSPPTAPLTKSPNRKLAHFDIRTRKQTLTEESKPYIEKSSELLKQVMADHPGTPWEARAEWELKRGFGVHLGPDYHPDVKFTGEPDPIPKL